MAPALPPSRSGAVDSIGSSTFEPSAELAFCQLALSRAPIAEGVDQRKQLGEFGILRRCWWRPLVKSQKRIAAFGALLERPERNWFFLRHPPWLSGSAAEAVGFSSHGPHRHCLGAGVCSSTVR